MMPAPAEKLPDPSEISLDGLIDDGLLVLYREMQSLKKRSVPGKLEAADARDLRDHLKLLFEIRDRQLEGLKRLTDEQLKQLITTVKTNETE